LYVFGLLFISLVLFSCDKTEKFTVTFNANTGQLVGDATVEVDSGSNVTSSMLPTASKAGHTFKGWFTSAAATGDAVKFPYKVTGNVTFYAGYKEDEAPPATTHVVTFNLNGGTSTSTSLEVSVEEGSQLKEADLPAGVAKEGYTFEGWYLDEALQNKATFPLTIDAPKTLYAKWEAVVVVTYRVTFDQNGGVLSGDAVVIVESGENIQTAPTATRDKHNFLGWNTKADGTGDDITFPYTPTSAIKLYAKWEKQPVATFTVTLDANGGTLTGEATLQVDEDETMDAPVATRDGYTLTGWNTKADGTGDNITFPYGPTSDIKLYAKWKEAASGGSEYSHKYVYEAETKGVVTGTPSQEGADFVETDVPAASGESSLGYLSVAGNYVTFTVTADAAGTVDLEFMMSSTAFDMTNWIVPDQAVNSTNMEIKVNDVVQTFEEQMIVGSGAMVWSEDWSPLMVNNVTLKAGANTIVIKSIDGTFPNLDYLAVHSNFGLDGTKVKIEGGGGGGSTGGSIEGFDHKYVYEAETKGTLVGEPSSSGANIVETSATASGGQSLGYLNRANNAVEFKVTAPAAGKAIIEFMLSSNLMESYVVVNQTINTTEMNIIVNGTAVPFDETVVKGSGEMLVFNQEWTPIRAFNVDLVAGENTISLKSVGTAGMFPNFDYMAIYTTLALTDGVKTNVEGGGGGGEEPPVEVTYDGNINVNLIVKAYPAGPAFESAIIEFAHPVKLTAEDLTTLQVTGSGGWGTPTPFTNTEAFLSDKDGKAVTTATSKYVTLKFQVTLANSGISGQNGAFSYGWQTGRNTWKNISAFKLSLSKALNINDVDYDKLDATKVTMSKTIPEFANWDLTGSHKYTDATHGEITLLYADYKPTAIAGGVKNPLIIWLHGAGEGGTDPSIVLLGNEVLGLGRDYIQKYFKSGEQTGAYVLAVQAPTMWMDDGTGEYGSASMYKNALWATIKAYVAANGDIDPTRIYIGGCSNGGFMTMEMLLSDTEKYFAAAYPICQAYSYANITAAQKTALKDRAIWFIHSNDDTTVRPTATNNLYIDLINLGATNVHYTLTENVTYDGVSYMGHFSWVYAFRDEVKYIQPKVGAGEALADSDLNPASTTKHPNYDTMWAWMAAQKKAAD